MNIVIVAVGGQGALFTARVIGAVALQQDLDVKVSEVHGMSQRGGSVITHVRYGKAIASPIVEEGFADLVIAMEMLEGARAVSFLKPDGVIIINEQKINPMPVLSGTAMYPSDIISRLQQTSLQVHSVNALKIAHESGNSKAVNAVLLGCMAKFTEFKRDVWIQGLKQLSPAKFVDSNISAFDKGYITVQRTI